MRSQEARSREASSRGRVEAARPDGGPADPGVGYRFAALNALISGFAVFINSQGVRTFDDSTLYTALKNGVVGLAMLLPFVLSGSRRRELSSLDRRQWGLLVLIALVAGSISYALDFRGLKMSTAPTASLIYHAQFLWVAVLAAFFLGERFSRSVWVALGVLAVGLSVGVEFRTVRWDAGVPYLIASTLLTAVGAVLIKVALRTVSLPVVVASKMTLGSALLFLYLAAGGRLAAVGHLAPLQWAYVLVTGLILLAFTLTEVVGLRHASATGVTAISAASPVITTLLVVVTRGTPLTPVRLMGLGLVLASVLVVYTLGRRDERFGQGPFPAPTKEVIAP
ncbi:MAG: DMT family transporter [Bacillota bacterium]|nr:DMT family transporter [Bacillota bacterium]